MLLLASTTDELRLTASVLSSLDVRADWVDLSGGMVTPGRTNSPSPLGGSPATIVASPASSTTYRTVKTLSIRNRHASNPNIITLIHRASGPVDAELIAARLRPGASLHYDEHQGFSIRIPPFGAIAAKRYDVFTDQVVGVLHTIVLDESIVSIATANIVTNIRQLSLPVRNGQRYWARWVLMYTASAAIVGSRWVLEGPSQITSFRFRSHWSGGTGTLIQNDAVQTYDFPSSASSNSASTGANIAEIEGFVDVPQAGNDWLYPKFASETTGAITVLPGSFLTWMRVT